MLASSGTSPLGLNESGLLAVGSYFWNTDTLSWDKATTGGGTATVTIRSVTDGTNRIVASVDVNGNRTATTYDVADE